MGLNNISNRRLLAVPRATCLHNVNPAEIKRAEASIYEATALGSHTRLGICGQGTASCVVRRSADPGNCIDSHLALPSSDRSCRQRDTNDVFPLGTGNFIKDLLAANLKRSSPELCFPFLWMTGGESSSGGGVMVGRVRRKREAAVWDNGKRNRSQAKVLFA